MHSFQQDVPGVRSPVLPRFVTVPACDSGWSAPPVFGSSLPLRGDRVVGHFEM